MISKTKKNRRNAKGIVVLDADALRKNLLPQSRKKGLPFLLSNGSICGESNVGGKMCKSNKIAILYSAITLVTTFLLGQILLILYPNGNTTGSLVLFILMNLVPMIVVIFFAKYEKSNKGHVFIA